MKTATCTNDDCDRVGVACNADAIPDADDITCGTCGELCERGTDADADGDVR